MLTRLQRCSRIALNVSRPHREMSIVLIRTLFNASREPSHLPVPTLATRSAAWGRVQMGVGLRNAGQDQGLRVGFWHKVEGPHVHWGCARVELVRALCLI